MRTLHRRTGGLLICAVLVTLLAGCADDSKGMGDAPVKDQRGENSPAEVYNFPDHFGNLATKCVGHGYRAYVTTNKGAPSNIEVVPDPACGPSGGASTPQATPPASSAPTPTPAPAAAAATSGASVGVG